MSVFLAQVLDHPDAREPALPRLVDRGLPVLAPLEALEAHERRAQLGVLDRVKEVSERALVEDQPPRAFTLRGETPTSPRRRARTRGRGTASASRSRTDVP